MTKQLLCTTGEGVQTIRTDLKKRSRVDIKSANGFHFHTMRFVNVPLEYHSPYLNWENYNCCGGWVVDRAYLNHAVQNNQKLYASFFREDLAPLVPELDALGLCYGEEPDHPALAYVCKPGCVADYLDLEEILKDYERLGFTFDEDEISYLERLVQAPLQTFSERENPFYLDYANPEEIEYVFVGMLLGYPIESTAHILERIWA